MKKTTDFDILLSSNKWKYTAFSVLFIFLSLLSFIFISHLVNTSITSINFKIFTYDLFIKLTVLMLIYFAMDALRLYYILKSIHQNIEVKYLMKLVFVNMFISGITPLATGGGFVQVYYLIKKGISLGDAVVSTTIRTAIPIVFFIIMTPIVLIVDKDYINLFSNGFSLPIITIGVLIYVAIALVFYKLLNNIKSIKWFFYKLLKFAIKKRIISKKTFKKVIRIVFKELDNFIKSIKKFFHSDSKNIFLSVLFSLLFLFSLFLFPVLIVNDLGYNVSLASIIGIQIIVTFIMYFAPTPGATGIAEGSFAIIFAQFVDKSNILSVIFIWRFFTMYIGVFIGMLIFFTGIVKSKFSNK
ncbi:lysylphosphatidylglycerol synthase transmembrane domain-containing protein [Helicovermis profundi]